MFCHTHRAIDKLLKDTKLCSLDDNEPRSTNKEGIEDCKGKTTAAQASCAI